MDLNLLKVFLVLSETRSVNKTAEALHLTQSAVSHALNRLRSSLNDKLFIPSRKGLIPTTRAESILGPIQEAIRSIEKTVSTTNDFKPEESTRRFRVGVNNYAESWLTPKLIDFISKSAPAVTVDIINVGSVGSVDDLLESRKLDLVIDSEPHQTVRQLSEKIADIHLTSLVRRDIFNELGSDPATVWQKAKHIVYRQDTYEHKTFDAVARQSGFIRKISATVPSAHSMMAIAATSGYVCTIPVQLAERFAARYELQILPIPFTPPSQPIYLSWHELSASDASVFWLRENVKKLLKDSQ